MTDFREQLAEALAEHVPHVGWGAGKWSAECLSTECRFYASGNGGIHHATAAFNAHVADALIDSEPLRSLLARLADYENRIARVEKLLPTDKQDIPDKWRAIPVANLRAALSGGGDE